MPGKYVYINQRTGDTINTDLEEEDALELLPENNNFAQSLKQQYVEKRGNLSETQKFWIMKLATEQDQFFACDTTEILKTLQKGRIVVKYAELDMDLRLYQNGTIYFNGNRVGKYTEKGLQVRHDLKADVINKFLLAFIKEGPTQCFDRLGIRTGFCCYCGLKLTHPISVRLGRGPVCSDNHGLPFPWAEYQASLKEKV